MHHDETFFFGLGCHDFVTGRFDFFHFLGVALIFIDHGFSFYLTQRPERRIAALRWFLFIDQAKRECDRIYDHRWSRSENAAAPATVTGNAHVTTDAVGKGHCALRPVPLNPQAGRPANTTINPVRTGCAGSGSMRFTVVHVLPFPIWSQHAR